MTAIAPYYSPRFRSDSRGDQYAPGGHLLLAYGTGDDWPGGLPADYFDLSAGPGVCEAKTPDFDAQLTETGRTIPIEVRIWGDTPDDVWLNVATLRQWLKRAEEAGTAQGGGLPVCLWVKLMTGRDASLHTTKWVYFDIRPGSDLQMTVKVEEEFKETPFRWGKLILECQRYARGDTIPGTWSGTLTAGSSCTLYIPNVPGDAPALPKLTVEDLSTAGRWTSLRVWRRAYDGMVDGDITFGYEVTATIPTVIWLYRTAGTTAGTFTLQFGANTTAALAYNVSAAALQTALRGLASIGGSNVTVTGTGIQSDPFVVAFAGSLAGAVQPSFTVVTSGWTASNDLIQQRQTGLTLSDATASGGSTAEIAVRDQFVTIGVITSTGAARNRGRARFLGRLRSSQVIPNPPVIIYNASSLAGTGFAAGQTVYVRVSTLDAGGLETAASLQVAVALGAVGPWAVTVQAQTAGGYVPASFRVYYADSSGTWKYNAFSNAGGTDILTATVDGVSGTVVTALPPNIPSATGPIIVASVALDTPNPQYQSDLPVSVPSLPATWVLTELGSFWTPPTGIPKNATLPWRGLIQAQASVGTPTVDADLVLAVPHDAQASYVGVSIADDPAPSQRYWVIEHTPAGRTTALVYQSSDDSLLGQADAVEQLTLEPGNNKLLLVPEKVDGSFDVIGSKLRVKCDITPRYHHAGRPAW